MKWVKTVPGTLYMGTAPAAVTSSLLPLPQPLSPSSSSLERDHSLGFGCRGLVKGSQIQPTRPDLSLEFLTCCPSRHWTPPLRCLPCSSSSTCQEWISCPSPQIGPSSPVPCRGQWSHCLCNSDAQQHRCHLWLFSVLCSRPHSELTTTSCWFSGLNLLKALSSSCLWPLGLGCHLFQGAFSVPLELDGMSPLGPRGLSCLACTLSLSVGSPRAASISYLLGIPMSATGSGP